MSYLDNIDVRLVEVPMMYLLSIRKMVQCDFPNEYDFALATCFKVQSEHLTIIAPWYFFIVQNSVRLVRYRICYSVKEYVTGTKILRRDCV